MPTEEISTYRPGRWIVTIIDRAPRTGERGFWIDEDDDLETALDKLVTDHDGGVRSEWGRLTLREPIQYDDDGMRCVTVVVELEES